ncbi:MAG: GNAT family N-acetyltransferase [Clostridia bacterium]|nr:GNAT family N-acetyltransferase [Clostridia bacterium]
MEYEIKPLTPEDAGYIEDRVNDCVKLSSPMWHTADEEELVLKAENDEGETIGGSILEFGGSVGARVQLSMLWVDERYRGKGLGSMLICESERIARERGCCISSLCTLDFQAPDMYKKHGYSVYAVYEDRPRTHSVYYMSKRIDGDDSVCSSKNGGTEKRFVIKFGSEDDAKIIARGLKRHDDLFAPSLHKTIQLSKKLVDENGRMIAGIVAGVDGWDGCYIANMYVEQAHRDRGLGSHLLHEVEREARENGAYMLIANAFDWNVGFFKKNGCAEAGALKCEPQGPIIYELVKQL